ncbi:universal stress protein [Arthrobacter sp. MDT2-2]
MTPPSAAGKPVVVGYDGSDGAKRAVLWAARYAAAAGLPLVVAHCWPWPLFTKDLGPVPGVQDSGLRRQAETTAEEGRTLAAGSEPDLDVGKRIVIGFPAEALTRLSTEASLVVTGTRGLGGFSGLLVGSASLHLASSAACPIVVVRDARPRSDAVLVPVDGSPESDRAVATAGDLAVALRKSIHLLHVEQARRRHPAETVPDPDPVLERSAALLAARPGIAVTTEHLTAPSIPGLILERARSAAGVVIGAKGHSTLGVRLGSTVHAVLHHAQGNVIVVR